MQLAIRPWVERGSVLEPEAYQILESYGLSLPRHAFTTSVEEAREAARSMGFPVVLKVVSPQIIHKSDAGGVIVGIKNLDELEAGFRRIRALEARPGVDVQGVLVVEQARAGHELIIGGLRDEEFGPVVMFGMGGVFVEVLKDVAFALAPVGHGEALDLIKTTAAGHMLRGLRGREPADVDEAARIISIVSRIMAEVSEIAEIDLNPVVAYPKGCAILDARILLVPG
jgi:acetyl-CoA synthetase (ADP-forming)